MSHIMMRCDTSYYAVLLDFLFIDLVFLPIKCLIPTVSAVSKKREILWLPGRDRERERLMLCCFPFSLLRHMLSPHVPSINFLFPQYLLFWLFFYIWVGMHSHLQPTKLVCTWKLIPELTDFWHTMVCLFDSHQNWISVQSCANEPSVMMICSRICLCWTVLCRCEDSLILNVACESEVTLD